jgi:Immunoglobulin I-set domain.
MVTHLDTNHAHPMSSPRAEIEPATRTNRVSISGDPGFDSRRSRSIFGSVLGARGALSDDQWKLIAKEALSNVWGYALRHINPRQSKLPTPFVFSIPVKPFPISEPSDATVLSGSVVEFVCRVGGDPLPTILWRRDDGKMPTGRAKILDDRSLQIENVGPQDEGLYICDVENLVGSISLRASLTVHCK